MNGTILEFGYRCKTVGGCLRWKWAWGLEWPHAEEKVTGTLEGVFTERLWISKRVLQSCPNKIKDSHINGNCW